MIVVAAVLAALLVGFLGTTPESPLPPTGDDRGSAAQPVTAAVLAPIGEEVFYRGFALTAWLAQDGRPTAIMRSAVFFAFVHILTLGAGSFEEGVAQAVIAFVVRLPVAWRSAGRSCAAVAVRADRAARGVQRDPDADRGGRPRG